MTYRPLPACVTITNSTIEGLGLFATENIPVGFEFGISHVLDKRFENGYIRTPLGGFINHSIDPNCETEVDNDGFVRIKSVAEINIGDEITLRYNLYEVNSV